MQTQKTTPLLSVSKETSASQCGFKYRYSLAHQNLRRRKGIIRATGTGFGSHHNIDCQTGKENPMWETLFHPLFWYGP